MSRPARGKLLLVLSFVLTLGAGIVVGMGLNKAVIGGSPVVNGPTPPPLAPPPNPGSWFVKELGLSAEQSEQMKSIWSQAMEGTGRELFDRRRSLYRDRDKAIEAIYTEDQRTERERIRREYDAKLAENSKERDKLVQTAVEKTKAMLSDEQRAKYEKMLRERNDRDRDRHRGPSTRPGTQPSDRPPGPIPFGQGFPGRRGGDDGREGRGPDGRSPDGRGPEGRGDFRDEFRDLSPRGGPGMPPPPRPTTQPQ